MNNLIRLTKKFIKKLKISSKTGIFTVGSAWGTFEQSPSFDQTPQRDEEGVAIDKRLDSNPVDVVAQLIQKEVPMMSFDDLDKTISLIEKRIKVMKRNKMFFEDENLALLYVKARKRYKKFSNLLSKWPIVTDAAVTDLLNRHKLCRVSMRNYTSVIPTDGLIEISKFREAWNKLWVGTEDPEIVLIVKESLMRETEKRKDPIVLGRSPLGNWWHLIGAWDEEVKYVNDILYR